MKFRQIEDIPALRRAFQPHMKAKVADELAFHFGDILVELEEVVAILNRAVTTNKITWAELTRLRDVVPLHWMYHLKKLEKLLHRMEENRMVRRRKPGSKRRINKARTPKMT